MSASDRETLSPEREGPSAVRALDHVGLTVPNLDEATRFFVDAFGAEVLYELASTRPEPTEHELAGEQARLGTRPGSRWIRSVLLRLGEGPSLELFEYDDPEQRPPQTPSDLGIQHFAVYVDDIERASQQVVDAGGTALDGPSLLPGLESGEGNSWRYTLAPWGGVIELVAYPSPQPYEGTTSLRRWRPAITPKKHD